MFYRASMLKVVFLITISCLCASTLAQTSSRESAAVESATATNNSSPQPVRPIPSKTEAIGYGFLATTVTNMASLFGLVFQPLNRYRCYPILMLYMVGLAVGSLLSSSFLVLIPEALHLPTLQEMVNKDGQFWYLKQSCVICAGLFIFLLLEFAFGRLRVVFQDRRERKQTKTNHKADSLDSSLTVPVELNGGDGDLRFHSNRQQQSVITLDFAPIIVKDTQSSSDQPSSTETVAKPELLKFSTPNLLSRLTDLEGIVWMVLIGDAFHNLMDGLTLGAAFSHDLSLGLGLTIAIMCEELPHELGDVAILIQAGLSVPLALVFNFLSACSAYIGFLIGIFVGETPTASSYIFAMTSGFFVYIAVADMIPEMRSMQESLTVGRRNIYFLFFVSCCGLLTGFSCILAVALLS